MIEKLKHYFLIAFICLCPLVYNTSYQGSVGLREYQEHFFHYSAICFFALFIGNIWISSFLILNVLLYIYNGASIGSMQVLNVLFGSILFLLTRSYFAKHKFEEYSKYILYVALLSIFWMGLQLFGIDPLFKGQSSEGILIDGVFRDPVGFFAIKMANATYINLALPILAGINIWLAPLLFIPIIFSLSSSCVLASAIVSMFYTYYLNRKLFFIMLIIGVLGTGVFVFRDYGWDKGGTTFKSRFPVWHAAVALALKNPIGYGPDSFRNFNKHKNFNFAADYDYNLGLKQVDSSGNDIFHYYSMSGDSSEILAKTEKTRREGFRFNQVTTWDNPHNFIITIIFEYGIFGIFILCGFLREIYYRFRFATKSKELVIVTSCILVYLITGLTHFPFHLARIGYLFPIFLGVFYNLTDSGTRHARA